MAWATRNFWIGDSVIEVPQALSLTQSYEEIGGVSTHRTMSGAAIRQYNWRRLKTHISGDGMVPPGLSGIDWSQPQLLKCAVARYISSPSNTISLPSTARSDTGYTPTGRALVGGMWLPTSISVASSVATLTTVQNAVAYMVEYFPELTAYIAAPNEEFDRTQSKWRWSIDAEEV